MDNNTQREIKRILAKYGFLLDPIMIIFILVVVVVPVLTVVNLSPKTSQVNVLGATSTQEVKLQKYGGIHSVIEYEDLKDYYNGTYVYSAQLSSKNRLAKEYSKPILYIENNTSNPVKVHISGDTDFTSSTSIGILANNVNYNLRDSKGKLTEHSIIVQPNQKSELFLSIKSENLIQYDEKVIVYFSIDK